MNLKLQIVDNEKHARGKIYKVSANGKAVLLLLTFHALERMKRWKLSDRQVLRTLLEPEEVLKGHRDRYIAHRQVRRHVVRVIYEYDGKRQLSLRYTTRLLRDILKAEAAMKIKYSRDADILVIQLREGKPVDSRDIAEGIIVHLTAKGQPLEIEILDASKVVEKKDVEVALDALFP